MMIMVMDIVTCAEEGGAIEAKEATLRQHVFEIIAAESKPIHNRDVFEKLTETLDPEVSNYLLRMRWRRRKHSLQHHHHHHDVTYHFSFITQHSHH